MRYVCKINDKNHRNTCKTGHSIVILKYLDFSIKERLMGIDIKGKRIELYILIYQIWR